MVTELDWETWPEERLLYCNIATLAWGQELPSADHFRATYTPKTFFRCWWHHDHSCFYSLLSGSLQLFYFCHPMYCQKPSKLSTTYAVQDKMLQHSKPITLSSTGECYDSHVSNRSHCLDFKVNIDLGHVEISSAETVQHCTLSGCGLHFRRSVLYQLTWESQPYLLSTTRDISSNLWDPRETGILVILNSRDCQSNAINWCLGTWKLEAEDLQQTSSFWNSCLLKEQRPNTLAFRPHGKGHVFIHVFPAGKSYSSWWVCGLRQLASLF